MDVDAYIPDSYIRNEMQKLDVYKRIAGIRNQEEYEDMLEELLDRFGEMPKPVQNLLAVARLKAGAHRLYMTEVNQKGNELWFVMYEKAKINTGAIDGLLKEYKGNLKFVMDAPPYFLYKELRKNKNETVDILALAAELLGAFAVLREDA